MLKACVKASPFYCRSFISCAFVFFLISMHFGPRCDKSLLFLLLLGSSTKRLHLVLKLVYVMLLFKIPCCSCAMSEEMFVVSYSYCLLGEYDLCSLLPYDDTNILLFVNHEIRCLKKEILFFPIP